MTTLADVADVADRPVHVVCCDPDTAVCGANVSGQDWVPNSTETTCRLCALVEAEDLPCGMCRGGAW